MEGELKGLFPGDQQEAGGSQRSFLGGGGSHRWGGLGWAGAGPGEGAVLLRSLSTMTSFTRSFPYRPVCSSNTNHCRLYVTLAFVCVLSVPRIMSIKADILPFSAWA